MRFAALLCATVGVAQANYKSGAVAGYEKFTYGKFITRMRAPNRMGTVSSFFTYWNGPEFYSGGWNELDIEIVPSVMESPFSMNAIYGDGNKKNEKHDYVKHFDPLDDWHIYEMVWHPKFISWSLDNHEVRRIEGDDPSIKYMNKGQSLMMNFWTPTFDAWGQGFEPKDMPWYCIYDYVETYTYNADTNGFDFHWKDDFNTFDSKRWHKSDATTFDHNSTTFRAEQAFTHGGNLVLKLENDDHSPVDYDGDFHRWGHGEVHWTPEKGEPVEIHQQDHEAHHGWGYEAHDSSHWDPHGERWGPHWSHPGEEKHLGLESFIQKGKG
jgi:beta-glucanase (GH16 family)